jgi:hypothetical protein
MGFEPTTPTLARLCSMPAARRPRSQPSRGLGSVYWRKVGDVIKPTVVATTNALKSLALLGDSNPCFRRERATCKATNRLARLRLLTAFLVIAERQQQGCWPWAKAQRSPPHRGSQCRRQRSLRAQQRLRASRRAAATFPAAAAAKTTWK